MYFMDKESVWAGKSIGFVEIYSGFMKFMGEFILFLSNSCVKLSSFFYFYLFHFFQVSCLDKFLFVFGYLLFNLVELFVLKFSEIILIYILFSVLNYDLGVYKSFKDVNSSFFYLNLLSFLFKVFLFHNHSKVSIGSLSVSKLNGKKLNGMGNFEDLMKEGVFLFLDSLFFFDVMKSCMGVMSVVLSLEFNFFCKVFIGFIISFLEYVLDLFSLKLGEVYEYFFSYNELFLFNFWCLISYSLSFFESFNFYIGSRGILLISVYFFNYNFFLSYVSLFMFFLESKGMSYPNMYLFMMYFCTCSFSLVIVCFFLYSLKIFLGIFYKLMCIIQIFKLFPMFVFMESFYFFLKCFLVFFCLISIKLVIDFTFIFIVVFFWFYF